MVTLYDNCNSCVNKAGCSMKLELKDLRNDIFNRYRMTRSFTQDNVTRAIRCGKYKSDDGKGAGM